MVQKLHSSVKRWLKKAPRFSIPTIIQGVTKTPLIRVKIHSFAFRFCCFGRMKDFILTFVNN